jgi:hypothetical protein
MNFLNSKIYVIFNRGDVHCLQDEQHVVFYVFAYTPFEIKAFDISDPPYFNVLYRRKIKGGILNYLLLLHKLFFLSRSKRKTLQ